MAVAPSPDLRASDADRERAVAALREHAAAGRLDPQELEERVGAALGALTLAELEVPLADLPGPVPATPARRRRLRAPGLRGPWRLFVRVAVLLVAIWALGGADDPFWPMWPLIGMAIWATAAGGCGRRRQRPECRESHRGDAVWL